MSYVATTLRDRSPRVVAWSRRACVLTASRSRRRLDCTGGSVLAKRN